MSPGLKTTINAEVYEGVVDTLEAVSEGRGGGLCPTGSFTAPAAVCWETRRAALRLLNF